MLTLGIETSCDETSVAIVRDGRDILANVVSSQIQAHAPYGGVVPEIASREHLRLLPRVLAAALAEAATELDAIDAFAVTRGPGLVGALLVGVSVAKGLAFARARPIKGVHHLEGHIAAVSLSHGELRYPALALVVSGGHTHIYSMAGPLEYRLVGRTLDDAAGEAFDKVGKALGLPYPAGPVIDDLAERGVAGRFRLPRTRVSGRPLDMSFSGLKTAAVRTAAAHQLDGESPAFADLLAEFRQAVVDVLLARVEAALATCEARTILVTGGVAANRLLRRAAAELGRRHSIPVLFPELALTSDNGAMIAAAGHHRLAREPADGLGLDAVASWDLEAIGRTTPETVP